jgi:hypothetical protein
MTGKAGSKGKTTNIEAFLTGEICYFFAGPVSHKDTKNTKEF